MKKYRIKEIDGMFYPQERFVFCWDNIKLQDRATRDWFVNSLDGDPYKGMAKYLVCKDAWDVIMWIKPEFMTLESARLFIEEYKKFLEESKQKQKAKYYY